MKQRPGSPRANLLGAVFLLLCAIFFLYNASYLSSLNVLLSGESANTAGGIAPNQIVANKEKCDVGETKVKYVEIERQHPITLFTVPAIQKNALQWKPLPPNFKSPRMIIGVPGVLRAVSGTKLIQQTIEKLIEGMSAEQRQHFKIIVINAERDLWRGWIFDTELRTRFKDEVESGLVTIVSVPPTYYPASLMWKRCDLARSFGDKLMRILWRDKQVLDSIYGMHFALSVGGITDDDWYLELEDDSPPNIPNWADFVTNWMNEHFPRDTKSHEWTMIRFFADRQAVETKTITPLDMKKYDQPNRMPFSFGLMYKMIDLKPLADYAYEHFNDLPLDWLIAHYMVVERKGMLWQAPHIFIHAQHESTKKGVDNLPEVDLRDEYNIIDWRQCPGKGA